jgi:hypothetical protein
MKKYKKGKTVPKPSVTLHFITGGTKPHSLGVRGPRVYKSGKVVPAKVTAPHLLMKFHPGGKKNDFVSRTYPKVRPMLSSKISVGVKEAVKL